MTIAARSMSLRSESALRNVRLLLRHLPGESLLFVLVQIERRRKAAQLFEELRIRFLSVLDALHGRGEVMTRRQSFDAETPLLVGSFRADVARHRDPSSRVIRKHHD